MCRFLENFEELGIFRSKGEIERTLRINKISNNCGPVRITEGNFIDLLRKNQGKQKLFRISGNFE